jgi:IS30 family transposase
MDDNFQDVLDSLPEKQPRSRLEPYGGLIQELLRRGRTYREVARILADKCQLPVSISTIHDFVRLRSRSRRNPSKGHRVSPDARAKAKTRASVEELGIPPADDVRQRINALKLRPAPAQSSLKQFHYDPNEPLRLPAKAGKKRTDE